MAPASAMASVPAPLSALLWTTPLSILPSYAVLPHLVKAWFVRRFRLD